MSREPRPDSSAMPWREWERENAAWQERDQRDLAEEIIGEMLVAGIHRVASSFSGSGDSGQVDDIEAVDQAGREIILPTALRNKIDEYIEMPYVDWDWNNEGSSGRLEIVSSTGAFTAIVNWPITRYEARRTTYVLGQAKPGQKKPRARKRPRRKKGAP